MHNACTLWWRIIALVLWTYHVTLDTHQSQKCMLITSRNRYIHIMKLNEYKKHTFQSLKNVMYYIKFEGKKSISSWESSNKDDLHYHKHHDVWPKTWCIAAMTENSATSIEHKWETHNKNAKSHIEGDWSGLKK